MSKRFAALSLLAALGAAVLPGAAAAADLYGYGGDDQPAYHGRPYFDEGERGDGFGPGRYGARRAPGPVVYDERGGRYGDEPADRPRPAFGGDGPAFGPPRGFGPGFGENWRPAPRYRPAAVAVVPAYEAGYGEPEAGCTVERVRSVTPAGWRKTVTRRTCYGR